MNTQAVCKTLERGLYEYGRNCRPLAQLWKPYLEGEAEAGRLVIACNNADHTFAALETCTSRRAELLAGIRAMEDAFSPREVVLYLPEGVDPAMEESLKSELPAEVRLEHGKVNVRELGEQDLLHHLETIANIGRAEAGKGPVISVVVRQGETQKTVTVPLESTVADMVAAAGMTPDPKGWVVVGGWFGSLLGASDLARPVYGYANSCVELFPAKFCPVSYAQQAEAFAAANSCGKCTFCREGSNQLAQFLKNGVSGRGQEENLPWLHTLADAVAEESVCTFGQESTRFLQETLSSQGKEYAAHFVGKRCTADVCQAFTDYAIDGSLCIGCGKCREVCPSGAILDEPGYIHRIDAFDCTKCGKCVEACPVHAVLKVRAGRMVGPFKKTKVGYYPSSRRKWDDADTTSHTTE